VEEVPSRQRCFTAQDASYQFRNAGQSPSKNWAICTPSGFEGFFQGAAAIFADGRPPDMQRVMGLAGEFGLEILGPPPGH